MGEIKDKIVKDVQTKLEVVSEARAAKSHGGGRPQLRRTFSTEYTTMKSERAEHRATVLRRREQHREQLELKNQRLHTKCGRRRGLDKGPALHGGRHKGSDMVDE